MTMMDIDLSKEFNIPGIVGLCTPSPLSGAPMGAPAGTEGLLFFFQPLDVNLNIIKLFAIRRYVF